MVKTLLFGYRYGYSFVVQVKTEGICKDIAEDVKTRFGISIFN